MDGRRAREVAPVLDRVPRLAKKKASRAASPGIHLEGRLTSGWSVILGLGWPLAFMIGMALEPAPAQPDAAVPVAIELASLALFGALVATSVSAASRHPMAAAGGVVTGILAVAFSVACPISGHHGFGLWWIGQLGVMVAMLGASVAALGHWFRTTT
jgi:hypothetical protein